MKEIWKDVVGYEGLYQVSNLGNINSLSFGARNINPSYLQKPLCIGKTNRGYSKVQLYKNGKSQMKYVHRLVAEAFIPNPDNKPQVNHIDGNKSNNAACNLEWVTASENQKHAINSGLREPSPMTGRTGINNPLSKAILQYDLLGVFVREWQGIAEAARCLDGSSSSISACLVGKNKTACGSIWRYKQSSEYPLQIEPVAYETSSGVKRNGAPRYRQMHRIRQLSKDGALIRMWDNYKLIESETSYDSGNIYKVINGKYKSAYGFLWEYE